MTPTHLNTAKTALEAYYRDTDCGICKMYATNIQEAIEELMGLHERGAEFVRYTGECTMLKRLMEGGTGEQQQTDDSESE